MNVLLFGFQTTSFIISENIIPMTYDPVILIKARSKPLNLI